jgi:hypothetical protein
MTKADKTVPDASATSGAAAREEITKLLRSAKGGPHKNVLGERCSKGHLLTAENVRVDRLGRHNCKDCAKDKVREYREENKRIRAEMKELYG